MTRRPVAQLLRLLGLVVLCLAALQLVLALRIAAMVWVDPASTAFQRSEVWRLLRSEAPMRWRQQWVDAGALGSTLKRAVIASEDAGFVDHTGIEWDAIERAWERNQRAEARAAKAAAARPGRGVAPKLVGGSTITQQLAKNLFLSGERSVLRKAQEALLALWLEACLDKRRILEIYLNVIELGNGVFGAEAAARRYFGTSAAQLSAEQAARLAAMAPNPRFYERNQGAPGLNRKIAIILARMPAAELP